MPKIKPIKDLRNTNAISKECHRDDEPIFITRNGYSDLVVMSDKCYSKLSSFYHQPTDISSKDIFNIKKQSHQFGFVRVGCATIQTSISDVKKNVDSIKKYIDLAIDKQVRVLVFPELTLTGYTCRDLFLQSAILKKTMDGIDELKKYSKNKEILFFIGAPLIKDNSLYNCAIAICKGEILGVVPKSYIANYNEFYENRQFTSGLNESGYIAINDNLYPFGTKMLFQCENFVEFVIGVEICEDLWVPNPPSTLAALNGASVIVNLSASNELVSKDDYRRNLVNMTSARLCCGYVYCSAGNGESTTDVVFSSHNIISRNGRILKESQLFKNEFIYTELDIPRVINDRKRMSTFENHHDNYKRIGFSIDLSFDKLTVHVSQNPFLISNRDEALKRYRKILTMQAMSLVKRVQSAHADSLVIGLSGGLDSTLALLVAKEAFAILRFDLKKVYAITLPCFGTSQRTHDNALLLAKILGVSFKEINISQATKQHFLDIGHDIENKNTTYENSQARERTQVLMDFANDVNGIMVGTGDLSELCLGWTTYCGDHMSMYGVNASIPKTLVIELVNTYALDHPEVSNVLKDIIDTPISPELLPTINGQIQQKTEEKIGPYELIDFFIYYFLRCNFEPKKIAYLAEYAYQGKYSSADIKKWLKIFLKRFYANQFKRSCLPDGIKVGSVSISPRGDLRMPSDASVDTLISSLDE